MHILIELIGQWLKMCLEPFNRNGCLQKLLHFIGMGKTEKLTNTRKKEERLPILVGNAEQVKLVGVAKYYTGCGQTSGDVIPGKVGNILIEWNCKDSIASKCFDTTSSNTGHLTAACVAIQEKLGRALLWCAC